MEDQKTHDDAAQDKELIMQMLKKHMGDGASDEEMQAAMEAYQYMQSEGHKDDDAAKMACAGIKMAKHFAEKHKQSEGNKESESEAEAEAEKKKEAEKAKEGEKDMKEAFKSIESRLKILESENVKLKGTIAGHEAEKKAKELTAHVDTCLEKTKLPRAVTNKFRESIKEVKSKEEVDRLLSVFMEGYNNRGQSIEDAFVISFEKQASDASGKSGSDFSDCVID